MIEVNGSEVLHVLVTSLMYFTVETLRGTTITISHGDTEAPVPAVAVEQMHLKQKG